jgi:hypothetical protein
MRLSVAFIGRKREGRQYHGDRVEFFNASILGRREEGAAPVSEGEKSMRGDFCLSRRGVTRGCGRVQWRPAAGVGRRLY